MEINGKTVRTNGFFGYEGCHKMYVCENDSDVQMLKEYGYDILPISELPSTYDSSCELRFINSADLETTYVGQGEDADFEGFEAA